MVGSLQHSIDKNANSFWRYKAVCLPDQVETGQIKDVVVGYLDRHPESREKAAAELFINALIEVWKCPSTP